LLVDHKQSMKIQLLSTLYSYKSRKKAFTAVFINCLLMSIIHYAYNRHMLYKL